MMRYRTPPTSGGKGNRMIKAICTALWNISEWAGASLGPLAPWIFGVMIGRMPHKVKGDGYD
jgi:hypothetical protein